MRIVGLRLRLSLLALLPAATWLNFACRSSDSLLPSGAGTNSSTSAGPTAAAGATGGRQEESAFAQIAERSPSSAGFFIDDAGHLIVTVRDVVDDNSARVGASELIATGRISDARVSTGSIQIRRGQFTFRDLAHWRDLVYDQVLGKVQGVLSLDMNEKDNRVTIGLMPSFSPSLRTSLPRQLVQLGVDTAAISYRVHEPIVRTSGLLPKTPATRFRAMVRAPSTLNSTADTLVGGIEIQAYQGTCSLGIVADRSGVRGLVTASHCSQVEWVN